MAFDIIEEASKLARPQVHLSMLEDGSVLIEKTYGTMEQYTEMMAALLAECAKGAAEAAMESSGVRNVAAAMAVVEAFALGEFEAAFKRRLRAKFQEVKEDENSSDNQ